MVLSAATSAQVGGLVPPMVGASAMPGLIYQTGN